MRKIQEQNYDQFTVNERIDLTIAAISRDDLNEATKLWDIRPQDKTDNVDYMFGMNVLIMFAMLFFDKCIRHYNCIKKADEVYKLKDIELNKYLNRWEDIK